MATGSVGSIRARPYGKDGGVPLGYTGKDEQATDIS